MDQHERTREQLRQVEMLAQDLQQQECAATYSAQQQMQRAEALEANNTALVAMLEVTSRVKTSMNKMRNGC